MFKKFVLCVLLLLFWFLQNLNKWKDFSALDAYAQPNSGDGVGSGKSVASTPHHDGVPSRSASAASNHNNLFGRTPYTTPKNASVGTSAAFTSNPHRTSTTFNTAAAAARPSSSTANTHSQPHPKQPLPRQQHSSSQHQQPRSAWPPSTPQQSQSHVSQMPTQLLQRFDTPHVYNEDDDDDSAYDQLLADIDESVFHSHTQM